MSGLIIHSADNVIRGLQIVNFPYYGIEIWGGGQYNVIGGDRSVGIGPMGQGNLISGNYENGVQIVGSAALSNTVVGNYIGTDVSGMISTTSPYHSHSNGIFVGWEAAYNRIGGSTPGERNVIAGGIMIGPDFSPPMHNQIVGNYIGVNAAGTSSLGHSGDGICGSGLENRVGGSVPGEGNLISGNGGSGVRVTGMGNTISGNFIGTDASGMVALPNRDKGVSISDGASHNTIGGVTAAQRNIISGNGTVGVGITGTGSISNTVIGNYIGTDVSGTSALPNGVDGVRISDGASHNAIGGNTEGQRNIISGNANAGVAIWGPNAFNNTVSGNFIGTDADGVSSVPNQIGVVMLLGAQQNQISGMEEGQSNLVSGNALAGVRILGHGTEGNAITGNFIGTDASGTLALPNNGDGISTGIGITVSIGSSNNIMGPGNVVAFNAGHGIGIYTPEALGNTITQNSIHHNVGMGIELEDGGNGELEAPIITDFDLGAGTVRGRACSLCTVEVFSDDEDEGQTYEGWASANGAGNFVFSKGSALTGPNITATNTDADGNTSEFSFHGEGFGVYLPLVQRH